MFYYSLKSIIDTVEFKLQNPIYREPLTSETVLKIESQSDLRNYCLNQDTCVLTIVKLNGDPNDQIRYDKYVKMAESQKSKSIYSEKTFAWLNSTCQENLLKQLNIDIKEDGAIVFFNPTIGQSLVFNKSFERNEIDHFLDLAFANVGLNKDIKINSLKYNVNQCGKSEDLKSFKKSLNKIENSKLNKENNDELNNKREDLQNLKDDL